MKVSLVQQLLGQGFTAEQILAMEDDTEQAAPEQAAPEQATPNQATPNQAAPDQAAPEQATPEQAAPEQVPSWASALEASIAALTKTVQGYNRAHDEQPDDPANELDKALETYITGKAPATKGGKK